MLRIHLCLLGCLASHATSPPGVPEPLGERMTGEETRGKKQTKIPLLSIQAVVHGKGRL